MSLSGLFEFFLVVLVIQCGNIRPFQMLPLDYRPTVA